MHHRFYTYIYYLYHHHRHHVVCTIRCGGEWSREVKRATEHKQANVNGRNGLWGDQFVTRGFLSFRRGRTTTLRVINFRFCTRASRGSSVEGKTTIFTRERAVVFTFRYKRVATVGESKKVGASRFCWNWWSSSKKDTADVYGNLRFLYFYLLFVFYLLPSTDVCYFTPTLLPKE